MPRALGEQTTEDTLQADLERYCLLAMESGASEAIVIPSNYVSIDERALLKCVARGACERERPPRALLTLPIPA